MRKWLMAAWAASCLLALPAAAQPVEQQRPVCLNPVDPRIAALLAQFPQGGPALRAAIARAVEADPSLADVAVAMARNANPEQKQAIGAGLADAADYYAKIGLDWARLHEARIRTAMICADAGTRLGFEIGSVSTLAQGIPGFNNAGVTTNGCINRRPISPAGPNGPIPGC